MADAHSRPPRHERAPDPLLPPGLRRPRRAGRNAESVHRADGLPRVRVVPRRRRPDARSTSSTRASRSPGRWLSASTTATSTSPITRFRSSPSAAFGQPSSSLRLSTDGRTSFTWYREQPALLTWEDILELDRDGTLRFEAHTLTHPNLPALDTNAAQEEIAGSKAELENRLGRVVRALSYPSGLFGKREEWIAAEAGFQAAVSCEPGVNDRRTDRFALRRRQVDARDSLLDFRAKLGGGHDSSPPLRALYRRLRYSAG